MNTVHLAGRLTNDPEHWETDSGTTVTRLRIAVRGRKDSEFFTITVFGKLAETVAEYTGKGSAIAIAGRLTNNHYQDEAGIDQYRTDIIANDITFLSAKPE